MCEVLLASKQVQEMTMLPSWKKKGRVTGKRTSSALVGSLVPPAINAFEANEAQRQLSKSAKTFPILSCTRQDVEILEQYLE